ncbi:TolC family protein [Enhygromyxa salina]|uniref:TolC family protein n=1 Tax=Enhygromyxa salina TaxID=215803 RepID=UPI001C633AA2|nr:efflux transporter outer membrane subunit [Enhygromyxa salina]
MFVASKFALVATAAVLLSGGCARMLGDNVAREAERDVPDGWSSSAAAASAETSSAAQRQWDELFNDPDLRALIEEALDNNQELDIHLQEIIIAQTEAGARRGEYLPRLDGVVGGGVEKVGRYTSQGAADEANGVAENLPDLHFGLTASWEIDVWGKLRNAKKSADKRYLASIEARNFILTQVIAEIADSYYELLALDNQLELLDRYLEIQQDALEIARLKKETARATELEVQRFEAEVLKIQSLRYAILQLQIETENRINFLVGRFPRSVARDASKFQQTQPPAVDAGLPAELFDNRPDVREAQLLLEAAELDVKSAKARFFPSLSIDAELGYQSFNASHLIDTPASLAYGLAGNLVAPLLNFAGIKADYQAANARQMQAVLVFERTLLQAYTEVVTYLAKIDNLNQQFMRLREQVDKLEQAIETSDILYRSAHADYMEVLLTRRDALDAELELIETRLAQMQAVVGIYRALGGGWRTAK